MAKAKKEEFSYDEAQAEIEAIVSRLESRDKPTGFDTMISDVEKALALIKQCKKCIADAESRLAKVKSDDEADNEAEKLKRVGRHHP